MASSDSTARGYQFFEQDTGVARFIRPRYITLRPVWDVVPTEKDVSGIDVSSKPLTLVKFDLNAPEENLRNTVVQYGFDVLGKNLVPYVQALPDNYMRQHLFNVAYNRPILLDAIRLRMGDTLSTNPYTISGHYLTMWLLRAFAKQLNDTNATTFKKQADQLTGLADHLQFTIDRILVNYNLTDLPNHIIIDALEIRQTDNNGKLLTSNQTLFISQQHFEPWAAKGGDELLLVAQWGLHGTNVDDTTIANKASIMAEWEASQLPPRN